MSSLLSAAKSLHQRFVPSARRPARHLVLGAALAALLSLLAPAASQAKFMQIGSPLSVPATLNTAEDLSYPGTNTQVPASPEAPNGVFHTFHFGADTALWNFSSTAGAERVPATGQATKIEIEGCAQRATNGPIPLTTVHFQDLSPTARRRCEGEHHLAGLRSSRSAAKTAPAPTVTTYLPINLCVSAGDYVGFNDSGGYVPNVLLAAACPTRCSAPSRGRRRTRSSRTTAPATGRSLSPAITSAKDGFAVNRNEELLMRVTLATDGDATHICPGGKQGLPPALAPIRVSPQTDGVNHSRIVAVAIFCRVSPCKGVATLSPSGADTSTYGRRRNLWPRRLQPASRTRPSTCRSASSRSCCARSAPNTACR